MKEIEDVIQNLDKAIGIARSLISESSKNKDLEDYEESERIAARIAAIKIAFSYETAPWYARFRFMRKRIGGRWQLWRCAVIDKKTWVKVCVYHEFLKPDAPAGIIIDADESY